MHGVAALRGNWVLAKVYKLLALLNTSNHSTEYQSTTSLADHSSAWLSLKKETSGDGEKQDLVNSELKTRDSSNYLKRFK